MRPVGWLDLDAVLRAVSDATVEEVEARVDEIVARASIADAYRRRTGRRHPSFGDGTLAAAAWPMRAAPPVVWLDRPALFHLSVAAGRLAGRGVLQSGANGLSGNSTAKRERTGHVAHPHQRPAGRSGLGPDQV